eukprot:TRINITY_DN1075_c0_g1_i6.p1 TRINITY_DN1075_c0_g1~~TRINITY_DN1075_c0_g1_i6.p1  ORF type:complete len:192 (+),score=37.37 TRINITY_DN1075_c0_g1_i6:43-618(+)
MKIVAVIVLLVVVANCGNVKRSFDVITSTYNSVIEAIEARNQAAALKSAEKLNNQLNEYKRNVPPLPYRDLERYGYKGTACNFDLLRLQATTVSILGYLKKGQSQYITQDKVRTSELIKRTLQNCIIAEESFERNFDSNRDDPTCRNAINYYRQVLEEIGAKDGPGSQRGQNHPALLATFIACGTRQDKKN